MIKVCKAICVNVGGRKKGDVCDDVATHDFKGRACCWLHFQVLNNNSRPLEFVTATPLYLAGAQ